MKKWRLLFITLGLAFSVGLSCACASKQAVMVRAEEPAVTETIPEEETPAEEPKTEPTDWVKNMVETYIVPLFAGISITSVVSLLSCIAITIIKNKMLDRKLLTMRKEQDEAQAKIDEKYEQCAEILIKINNIYQLAMENEKLNTEVKNFIQDKSQYAISVIEGSASKIGKIENLVKVVTLLAQIEAKVAQQSSEVVKSGIIEDIQELSNLIKEIA